MTEHLDWSSVDRESTASVPEQIVTLQLPADLAMALQQRCQQLGQTTAEVILGLLQTAIQPTTKQSEANQPATQQDVQLLKARLSQLEELVPRLDALEGKLTAF